MSLVSSSGNIKIAAYLDQVHHSPIEACKILSNMGITRVCLRNVWSTNIAAATPELQESVKQAIEQHGLTVVKITPNIGNSNDFGREQHLLKESILLSQLYQCQRLSVGWGSRRNKISPDVLSSWIESAGSMTWEAMIKPVYEFGANSHITDPAVLAAYLSQHNRWFVAYDPASIMSTGVRDHFIKCWTILKNKIGFVDIKDFEPGKGVRLPGQGSTKLDLIISDIVAYNLDVICCLERGSKLTSNVHAGFVEYMRNLKELLRRIGVLDRTDLTWP